MRETEVWAQQHEADGRYKDAAYLHGRVQSDLEEESRIVPTLAAVYEKIGDYPAAELAREQLMGIIFAEGRGENDEEQIREVEKLSRLLNLFHTRLQVLGSASPSYAKLSIVYRAAALDLELLNAALLNQGLIVLDYLDPFNRSSLHIAVHKSAPNLARILLQKGANPNLKDFFGDTPLHLAVKVRTEAIVQKSLHWDPAIERTLLCEAVRRRKEWAVTLLLENGANSQAFDGKGRQALYYAIDNGQESMVKALLDHGGLQDATVYTVPQRTWLHLAMSGGNLNIIEMILKAGVDANEKDIWGDTPLHYLTALGLTHLAQIVNLLLEFGAQVNIVNKIAETPLHLAVSHVRPEVVQILLDAGADPYLVNTRGQSAMDIARTMSFMDSQHEAILKMLSSRSRTTSFT